MTQARQIAALKAQIRALDYRLQSLEFNLGRQPYLILPVPKGWKSCITKQSLKKVQRVPG